MKRRTKLRFLISIGPTREPIDPVRFLSNYSTGYMGSQLVAEALQRGHRVTVVSGPGAELLPTAARVVLIERAAELERALRQHAPRADVIIMAAAVADYQPVRPSTRKLKRAGALTLRLRATPDIIARLPRRPQQLVVGFAVETDRIVSRARKKLRQKRLDILLAQQASVRHTPFGRRAVRAWLLERSGAIAVLGQVSKTRVARVLLDKIEALWYGDPNARRISSV